MKLFKPDISMFLGLLVGVYGIPLLLKVANGR